MLENIDATTSQLRHHHNYTTANSCGADTIEQLMAGAQPHNAAHNDHLGGLLAELAGGWSAEMFTQRADMDIAMFHRTIVTKTCHVRAEGDGVGNEEVVLQVPVGTQPGTREHSLDVPVGNSVSPRMANKGKHKKADAKTGWQLTLLALRRHAAGARDAHNDASAACRRQCILLATWCVPGFVLRRTAC